MNYDGLSKLSYGVYLVGTPKPGGANSMLAFLGMQVEKDVLCLSVSKENLTHELLENEKKFNLSVLTEEATFEFLQTFGFKSGRDTNKLAGVECEDFNGFSTVVEHCNSIIECEVFNSVDCGSSSVFFGKILKNRQLSPARSMTSDYYQRVMNGHVSPKAPAYVARYVK